MYVCMFGDGVGVWGVVRMYVCVWGDVYAFVGLFVSRCGVFCMCICMCLTKSIIYITKLHNTTIEKVIGY